MHTLGTCKETSRSHSKRRPHYPLHRSKEGPNMKMVPSGTTIGLDGTKICPNTSYLYTTLSGEGCHMPDALPLRTPTGGSSLSPAEMLADQCCSMTQTDILVPKAGITASRHSKGRKLNRRHRPLYLTLPAWCVGHFPASLHIAPCQRLSSPPPPALLPPYMEAHSLPKGGVALHAAEEGARGATVGFPRPLASA